MKEQDKNKIKAGENLLVTLFKYRRRESGGGRAMLEKNALRPYSDVAFMKAQTELFIYSTRSIIVPIEGGEFEVP